VYPLSHQYTESSCSLRHLKGEDAAKGRMLEKLCAKNGAYWFLARMTFEQREDDYESYPEYTIDKHKTPAGDSIALAMRDAEEEQILVADFENYYNRKAADSEDEDEYTGNAHTPVAYRYHDTVIIFARKNFTVEAYARLNTKQDLESISMFLAFIQGDEHCPQSVKQAANNALLRCCMQRIAMADGQPSRSRGHGQQMSQYQIHLNTQRATYLKMFEHISDLCLDDGMGHLVGEQLRTAFEDKRWVESRDLVSLVAKHVNKEAPESWPRLWTQ